MIKTAENTMKPDYKNTEGYADLTAYLAIKRIGETDMEYNRGEIFECEMNNGDVKNVLVVSADYRSSYRIQSVITLNETPTNSDSVEIKTMRGIFYADPWMVGWCQNHRLQEYVCSANDEVMASVDNGISEALGIKTTERFVAKNYEVDAMKVEINSLKENLAAAKKIADRADTYKEMYEQLLNKIIER